MASAFSHAVVAVALSKGFRIEKTGIRSFLLGIFCAIAPDLDVIGFRYGVQYGDVWGHRGITHSLFFSAGLSLILTLLFYFRSPATLMSRAFLYLFACGSSHGLLDALTNGGLGVAFFSPFNTARYFFGFRPIAVSPIGVHQFFTERGAQVLISEFKWIWLPSLVFVAAVSLFERLLCRKRKD
ncbi:MAG: metal-dependent hydrolase [Methylobacter sp.]|nr:metal-dependent hydrolase [Methylobacter sp.]